MTIFKTPYHGWIALDRILRIREPYVTEDEYNYNVRVLVDMAFTDESLEILLASGFWPDSRNLTKAQLKSEKAKCQKEADEVLKKLLAGWAAVRADKVSS